MGNLQSTIIAYWDRFRHDRHQRLVLGSVLLVLAVVVAALVYWQLRLNGIAMTNETYCGYEEHTHAEECYETILICDLEETEGHVHNETCYDEEGNLICEIEEYEPHTHSEECYGTTLICEFPEHTHTVECLIDLNADVEDTTVWEATLPALTGDLRTDVVSIAHSQLGYTESTANYSISEDSLTHYGYTRYGAWYGNPYGDWSSMFAAFCLYYAGITEDFTFNAGAYAWTIDLANLGYYLTSDAYTPVAGDVVFVDSDLDGKADLTAIVVSVSDATGTITVIQGDYSVIDDVTGEASDTVALATFSFDDPTVIGYANIQPVNEDPDDTVSDDTDEEVDLSEEPTTLTFEGTDYIITVSYGEEAALPEGTELVAYEYAQDSENFLARYAEAALLYGWSSSETEEIAETDEEITITEEAVTASVTGEVTGYASTEPVEEPVATDPYHGFRLFNIGLYYDGAEIEPAAEVTITVTYTCETNAASVSVTHFGDTATETLDATLTDGDDSQSVTFASDTFSDFGIALASEEGGEETGTYTAVSEFDLTIYGSDDQKKSIYSKTVDDVLTDETYYYIPISYFETCLSSDNYPYSFDSTSTVTCPFIYVPDSNNPMAFGSTNYRYQYCYYAYYAQIGNNWYLRVTDTTGGETPRADVYYSPVYRYYLYLGSVNSSSINGNDKDTNCVSSGLITDFVGYENYTLIPISYFSDHIVESSLTATSTMTISGESCGYCTATDFEYKTTMWNAGVETPIFVYYNGAWYLRVQDRSTGYALPRVSIIGYTGSVGVYNAGEEFYLWIYNELTQVYASAEWKNGGFNVVYSIKDVISYTSPDDGKTYYYIPVSYFESALASYGYKFDEENIASCPLIYAPDANKSLDTNSNITTCLFATYEQVGDDWYVRVQDTSGYDIHRSNVYYTEYMLELYQGSYDSVIKKENITDYIGIGSRQVLIPISYFSDYVSASDLEAELTKGTLSATTSTVTICGTEYKTYTSSTYTFKYRPAYWQDGTNDATYVKYNNTWYLLVQDTGNGYSLPVRNKICYTGEIDGIVLNLGNGNGSALDKDYGDASLRYTVALGSYADNDGNATICLPSDSDLSTTFTVATDGTNSATVALGEESEYDYKLVGWYNIATGEYYDVSGGSTTATVNINNYDNVFYADWIANSYDQVADTSASNIIETADTSSFVTIRMYDFSELFNLYSAALTQYGLSSETWTDSGDFYSTPLLDNDADANELTALGKSFIFFNLGTNGNQTTLGSLGGRDNREDWNKSETKGYKGLYDSDIIEMLFNYTDDSTLGSYYVGQANYLFSYDEKTSFYSYDSSKNAAVYQQSESRFYVYDSPQAYYEGTSIFLPYNSYSSSSSTYSQSSGSINYWFGVEIELNFYLPNDTGTILSGSGSGAEYGNQINGEDMVFKFRGDDDVWVFVDDDLILDIGGIHGAIDGEINFSTGEVTLTYSDGSIETSTISKILGSSGTSIAAGTHTLTMYYMERGASASNMLLSFNTIPEWEYESSSAGTMKVTKEWDDDNDSNRPTSILVGLFDRVGTYTSGDYTYNGTTYSFDSDGYSYDSDKLVNAYISNGYVYIRVDTETLTADDWTYTWTLLDSEKSAYYQILELTTLENYTTTYSYTTINEYSTYWTIVGDDTLNGTVTVDTDKKVTWTGILKDGLQIILTDGAQNGVASTSGFPTTYSGYVIETNGTSITTEQVQFSQKATLDDSSGNYVYGVTTAVPSTAIWTVEMTGSYDTFTIKGVDVNVPTFYLKDLSGNYLQIANITGTSDYELKMVSSKSEATEFSYNALGELNTEASSGKKVIIYANGSYALVDGRKSETATENVKVYIPTTTTIGSDYTITNTVLPSVTLKKVNATDTDKTLSGVAFEMYQKGDSGAVTGYYLLRDSTVTWNSDEQKLMTGSNGTITYKYLPDGTYYLKETATIDGYNDLTEELSFTISGGKVTAVGGNSTYIEIDATDANSLTIIVKNIPGVELPSTGSAMTPLGCAIVGGIISAIAVFALMSLKRRRYN